MPKKKENSLGPKIKVLHNLLMIYCTKYCSISKEQQLLAHPLAQIYRNNNNYTEGVELHKNSLAGQSNQHSVDIPHRVKMPAQCATHLDQSAWGSTHYDHKSWTIQNSAENSSF